MKVSAADESAGAELAVRYGRLRGGPVWGGAQTDLGGLSPACLPACLRKSNCNARNDL